MKSTTTIESKLSINESKEHKEHPDIALGKKLLKKMREEIVFSDDIIPTIPHMPTMDPQTMITYVYQDNDAKSIADRKQKLFDSLLHFKKTEWVRNLVKICMNNAKMHSVKYPDGDSIEYISVTKCGVGECVELSERLVYELLKANYNKTLNLVQIDCSKRGSLVRNFLHVFVVLGNCEKLRNNKLSSFAELDNDCVLLDPKFNICILAKDFEKHFKPYIEHYKYDRIEKITPAKDRWDCSKMFLNSHIKQVSKDVLKELSSSEIQKDIKAYAKKMMHKFPTSFNFNEMYEYTNEMRRQLQDIRESMRKHLFTISCRLSANNPQVSQTNTANQQLIQPNLFNPNLELIKQFVIKHYSDEPLETTAKSGSETVRI